MTKWEYREVFRGYDLNKLGAEGWELVAVVLNKEGYIVCHFKRPIEEVKHD